MNNQGEPSGVSHRVKSRKGALLFYPKNLTPYPLSMAFELIMLMCLFIGSAVFGDLIVEKIKTGQSVPFVNWLGSSAGAALALLVFESISGGLIFWVDPLFWIVQCFLVGGILGAIVDIPLLVYRNRLKPKIGRHLRIEIGCIIVGATILIFLLVEFRMNYQQVVLPF